MAKLTDEDRRVLERMKKDREGRPVLSPGGSKSISKKFEDPIGIDEDGKPFPPPGDGEDQPEGSGP